MTEDGSVDPEGGTFVAGLRSLAADKPIALKVSGRSMEPLLAAGSTVLVAPARRYWPGDVLAFNGPHGELVVHRLIGWRRRDGSRMLQTYGEGAGTVDRPIAPRDVIGKVVGTPARLAIGPRDRVRALCRYARIRWRERLRR